MVAGDGQTLDYVTLAGDVQEWAMEDGVMIQFASAKQLIAMKSGTGRARDEGDIPALRAIQAGTMPRSTFTSEYLRPGAVDPIQGS